MHLGLEHPALRAAQADGDDEVEFSFWWNPLTVTETVYLVLRRAEIDGGDDGGLVSYQRVGWSVWAAMGGGPDFTRVQHSMIKLV